MKHLFAVIACSLLLILSMAAEAGPREDAAAAELAKLGMPENLIQILALRISALILVCHFPNL